MGIINRVPFEFIATVHLPKQWPTICHRLRLEASTILIIQQTFNSNLRKLKWRFLNSFLHSLATFFPLSHVRLHPLDIEATSLQFWHNVRLLLWATDAVWGLCTHKTLDTVTAVKPAVIGGFRLMLSHICGHLVYDWWIDCSANMQQCSLFFVVNFIDKWSTWVSPQTQYHNSRNVCQHNGNMKSVPHLEAKP
jgi:hypothetical protein